MPDPSLSRQFKLADLSLEHHDPRIQARALKVAASVNRRAEWMDFSPKARRDFLRAAYRSLASDEERHA